MMFAFHVSKRSSRNGERAYVPVPAAKGRTPVRSSGVGSAASTDSVNGRSGRNETKCFTDLGSLMAFNAGLMASHGCNDKRGRVNAFESAMSPSSSHWAATSFNIRTTSNTTSTISLSLSGRAS